MLVALVVAAEEVHLIRIRQVTKSIAYCASAQRSPLSMRQLRQQKRTQQRPLESSLAALHQLLEKVQMPAELANLSPLHLQWFQWNQPSPQTGLQEGAQGCEQTYADEASQVIANKNSESESARGSHAHAEVNSLRFAIAYFELRSLASLRRKECQTKLRQHASAQMY